jgi:nicotinate-nucleotide adenylyltransferase
LKVGIMGGTFDPVHLAHLIIAEEARSKLELDYVIFIPSGEPWMKADQKITPVQERLEMVKLAIQPNAGFKLSTIEADRPGASYSVDTLETLWKELDCQAKLYFLIGWDTLEEMPRWKDPYRITKLANLVTFPRPGFNKPDIIELEVSMPELSKNLISMEGPYIGISSSDIRKRVAEGESIHYLVPDEVEAYIIERKLYIGLK